MLSARPCYLGTDFVPSGGKNTDFTPTQTPRLMRSSTLLLSVAAIATLSSSLHAQTRADSAGATVLSGFVVLHNSDTVAVESVSRTPTEVTGTIRFPVKGERMTYHLVIAPDETTPLVEVSAWRLSDPESRPARQQTRIIFKADSVAIDDITSNGMTTLVYPTMEGAVPYLNLSFGFLEQATMRAAHLARDTTTVPFFSLAGGQTAFGTVQRIGADSASVTLGQVQFRLQVGPEGQIQGGGIPAQQITVSRR